MVRLRSGGAVVGSLRIVVRQAAGYAVGTIGARALPLLALPLVLRRLNPAEFGRLELATSMTTVLSTLVGLGLIEGVYRYFAEAADDDERKTLLSTSLTSTLALSVVVCAVVLPLSTRFAELLFGDRSQTILASLVLLRIPLDAISGFSRDVLRLEGRVRTHSVSLLAEAIVGLTIALTAVFVLDGDATGYFLGFTVASLAAGCWNVALIRRWWRLSFNKVVWRRLAKFGFPLGLQAVAVYVYTYGDRALLAHLVSLESVGEYSVASKLTTIPLLLAGSFGRAWHPYYLALRTRANVAAEDFIGRSATAVSAMFVLMAVATTLMSPLLAELLAPDAYDGLLLAVAGLSMAAALQVSQEFTCIGMMLAERPARIAWIRGAGAVLNTVLNLLLIPRFGASGAAWATAATFASMSVVAYRASQSAWPLPFDGRALAVIFVGASVALLVIGRGLSSIDSVVESATSAALGVSVASIGALFLRSRRTQLEA